jgi:hypothetical protein
LLIAKVVCGSGNNNALKADWTWMPAEMWKHGSQTSTFPLAVSCFTSVLLHEHHDFFFASQRPATGSAFATGRKLRHAVMIAGNEPVSGSVQPLSIVVEAEAEKVVSVEDDIMSNIDQESCLDHLLHWLLGGQSLLYLWVGVPFKRLRWSLTPSFGNSRSSEVGFLHSITRRISLLRIFSSSFELSHHNGVCWWTRDP